MKSIFLGLLVCLLFAQSYALFTHLNAREDFCIYKKLTENDKLNVNYVSSGQNEQKIIMRVNRCTEIWDLTPTITIRSLILKAESLKKSWSREKATQMSSQLALAHIRSAGDQWTTSRKSFHLTYLWEKELTSKLHLPVVQLSTFNNS